MDDLTLSLRDVVEVEGVGEFIVGQIDQSEKNKKRFLVRLDRKYHPSITLEIHQQTN